MTKYLRKRDFEIKINNKSTVPIYEQIKRGIKLLIVSGYFKNGDHILSIRELASKLKVNPNTIIKVYYQLEAEGYLFSKPGTSYIVKIDEDKVKKEKFDFF
jgi:GntR family transcriptional regulator